MSHRNTVLPKLIDPQSVAVVGASTKPGSVGYVILENLITRFKGEVYPVNPKYDEVGLAKAEQLRPP